jgi:hypothetical protein
MLHSLSYLYWVLQHKFYNSQTFYDCISTPKTEITHSSETLINHKTKLYIVLTIIQNKHGYQCQ